MTAKLPPVLMYHHVEPPSRQPPPLHGDSYLSPDELERHLDELERGGFQTATLAAALAGEAPPGRTVVLTFDDGCRCFAEHVWPRLGERQMTATLFAVAGELGGSNRWDAAEGERREELLDAVALRQLTRQGVEVASHTTTHADVSALDAGELEAEIAGSKRRLEAAIGEPVRTFCYPWGRLSEAARQAVERAGYLGAVSIHRAAGASPQDRWALARMIVNPGDSLFELRLKASGLYPLYSRLPRLGVLSALRGRRGSGS